MKLVLINNTIINRKNIESISVNILEHYHKYYIDIDIQCLSGNVYTESIQVMDLPEESTERDDVKQRIINKITSDITTKRKEINIRLIIASVFLDIGLEYIN
jgi:hypothetical protein